MIVSLRPRLHDRVGSSASRTVAQLEELGVEPTDRQVAIGVRLSSMADPARRLLAETLVDMLLRLDPLVGEVVADMPGGDGEEWLNELATRIPFEQVQTHAVPDYMVSVGDGKDSDLLVDGAGWLAALGTTIEAEDDGNPVGSLSAATFGTAEVFKWAFAKMYPERLTALQFAPWSGIFSLASYDFDNVNPPMGTVCLDTTLVGLGGVGAGFMRAMVALGPRAVGSLILVDPDALTLDNLNRVAYASVKGAESGEARVEAAAEVLRRHCPNLTVIPYGLTYGQYKQRIPRRRDRVYDVIVTGLDNDEARWEVQRDMPRILIDGATGRDMNARVERVEFGRYGCLGCSRQSMMVPPNGGEDCDAPPDARAPSLSFLSSFPGILAAGEVVKEAQGAWQLRGGFDHIFRYGPNPDQRGIPAMRQDCAMGCARSSKVAQYRDKYPNERFDG